MRLGSTKNMFDDFEETEAENFNKKLSMTLSSFEVQKEVIQYVEINQYLIRFLSELWIP
jgi:hypothetical protein